MNVSSVLAMPLKIFFNSWIDTKPKHIQINNYLKKIKTIITENLLKYEYNNTPIP